jgi:hypothetical protein
MNYLNRSNSSIYDSVGMIICEIILHVKLYIGVVTMQDKKYK